MKYRMLIVSPYEGFKKMFSVAIQDFVDIETTIYSASLKQAEELVKTLDLSQYDIIISRGRSGQIIKNVATIPVINVDFSSYDILRSLTLARYKSHKKMAFVSFFNTGINIPFFTELLNIKTTILTPPPPQSPEDMDRLVQDLYENQNVELFIGDGACNDCAKKIGAESILVTSGLESMKKAINEALDICDYKFRILEENSFYRSIIEKSTLPIAIFDSNKKLIMSNLFSNENKLDIHKSLLKLFPRVLQNGKSKSIEKIGNMLLKIKGECIVVGNDQYILFNVYGSMPNNHTNMVYQPVTIEQAESSISLISNNMSLRNVWMKALAIVDSKSPILLYGSPGSGKNTFAHALYASSRFKHTHMISINCTNLDKKATDMLFTSEDSPLLDDNCVILFQNINSMSPTTQNLLAKNIENIDLINRCKIITTYTGDIDGPSEYGTISNELLFLIKGFPIFIPSLKDQPNEIPILAGSYLNELNQEYAIQIVGFEDEAMKELQMFNWEYGITQFKSIIRQLAITTQSQFISVGDVRTLLGQIETSPKETSSNSIRIDTNNHLDTIIGDILKYVLEEENMNQTKAAKRLGISRSTLWKRLRESSHTILQE